MAVLHERWGVSPSTIYEWRNAFLLRGLNSRVEWLDAGPLVVGLETACWKSVIIRVRLWREFGVRRYQEESGLELQPAELGLQPAA